MARTRTALLAVVALCGLAATGCQKKVKITFNNHTDEVLAVTVTARGEDIPVGSVNGRSSIRYTLRIPTDELPVICSAKVGLIRSNSFTINKDTEDELWFHRTEKGLSGPVGKKTPVSVTEPTGDVKVTSGPRTIVE